jgi:hypothetical protein
MRPQPSRPAAPRMRLATTPAPSAPRRRHAAPTLPARPSSPPAPAPLPPLREQQRRTNMQREPSHPPTRFSASRTPPGSRQARTRTVLRAGQTCQRTGLRQRVRVVWVGEGSSCGRGPQQGRVAQPRRRGGPCVQACVRVCVRVCVCVYVCACVRAAAMGRWRALAAALLLGGRGTACGGKAGGRGVEARRRTTEAESPGALRCSCVRARARRLPGCA